MGLRQGPAEGRRSAGISELALEPAGRKGPKARYRLPGGETATIEEAVLAWLLRNDPNVAGGLLAENRLYRTLFGLLFWDVLFSPVPGMFQHPYQSAPMDLGSRYFREARRGRIRRRLREIALQPIPQLLTQSHLTHEGESCQLVAFDTYSLTDLLAAAKALGSALPPIMERLAYDPARNGRGLPDLLLFTSQGSALACEVKGPGDQARTEQLLWHDRLLRQGVDVAIARVVPAS